MLHKTLFVGFFQKLCSRHNSSASITSPGNKLWKSFPERQKSHYEQLLEVQHEINRGYEENCQRRRPCQHSTIHETCWRSWIDLFR